MNDVYANVATLTLFALDEAVSSGDGAILLDLSQYNGNAQVVLTALEDASIAASKKLDVTVHTVASDSETTDSDNQIAAFTQLLGENDAGAVQKTVQTISMNLNESPKLASGETKVRKHLYQVKVVNTSTWAGSILVQVLVGGHRVAPVNALV